MDTTMITGAVALTGSGLSLYDRKEKKLNEDNARSVLATTVATTATAIAGASLNAHTMNEIHDRYASAYVDSMSDEELESALVKMDLLVAEEDSTTDVKTI